MRWRNLSNVALNMLNEKFAAARCLVARKELSDDATAECGCGRRVEQPADQATGVGSCKWMVSVSSLFGWRLFVLFFCFL